MRRFLPSGLYILSDHPIVDTDRKPFRKRECAGYDCLANKGILYARILLKGVPQPLELFDTHLNSRGAAGVSAQRSLLAHQLQVEELMSFIEQRRSPDYPMIFGGDFNMRNAPDRFETFATRKSWPLVHEWCVARENVCDVQLSWDGDQPWMDTQDLQGFASGKLVQVSPIRLEAMFDVPWRGAPLSDHDGLLVTYRLSWQRGSGDALSRCDAPVPDVDPGLIGAP
ncbi:hypothetical protein C7I55_27520 [Sphingomonas deserti]|uniref:Endonuclease/exonuclease/phosphatase domain-containing protein n=1 Tax=Allosphingosinicella deserti TaxID=2116704 RepID=A0A2P7QDZ3_9SPHN|nr:hypothetical protein C7I55_27520 [Sphingomonas deserti]